MLPECRRIRTVCVCVTYAYDSIAVCIFFVYDQTIAVPFGSLDMMYQIFSELCDLVFFNHAVPVTVIPNSSVVFFYPSLRCLWHFLSLLFRIASVYTPKSFGLLRTLEQTHTLRALCTLSAAHIPLSCGGFAVSFVRVQNNFYLFQYPMLLRSLCAFLSTHHVCVDGF